MAPGIRRRELIALLGGAAVLWPRPASAQQGDRAQALLNRIMRMHAEYAAAGVRAFFSAMEGHMGWTVQLPWSAGTIDQRRFDGLRLLRQLPAVSELAQLDGEGIEQLRVSRLSMDVVAAKTNFSQDPKFTVALAKKVYYGPLYFRERGPADARVSEPYMTLSVAGARSNAGVSVAEINLKMLWDFVMQRKLAEHDVTYILDAQGQLVAHPDISLVLRKTDMTGLPHVQAARAAAAGGARQPIQIVKDIHGRDVLAASAVIVPPGWLAIVELPVDEAKLLGE